MKHKIKDSEEYSNLEIPYLLTNVMCEEILNIKYKQRGNETTEERVSRRMQRDKYSALKYGLWIVYLEELKNKINQDSDYDFVFSYS